MRDKLVGQYPEGMIYPNFPKVFLVHHFLPLPKDLKYLMSYLFGEIKSYHTSWRNGKIGGSHRCKSNKRSKHFVRHNENFIFNINKTYNKSTWLLWRMKKMSHYSCRWGLKVLPIVWCKSPILPHGRRISHMLPTTENCGLLVGSWYLYYNPFIK